MDKNASSVPRRKLSKWLRIFPIIFFTIYLSATVLFFAAGSFEYPVDNPGFLYTFLVLVHIALFAGYWGSAFGRPRGYFGRWRVSQLLYWSAAASLLLVLPTSLVRNGSFIPNIVSGLANPGEAYARTASFAAQAEGLPTVEYLRILAGPFLGFLLPLTVFYWARLSTRTRIMGIAGILGTVALFIGMGANKAIADTVLLLPWMTFAGYKAGVLQLNRQRIAAIAACGVAAFILFLAFFAAGMLGREGSPVSVGFFPATGSKVDTENVLIRQLGETPTAVVLGLDIYLTPGYYALSLALREPFVPMFGVGNSTFLYRQAARLTGDNEILKAPYPVRIEKYGWDSDGLWSSIYPWIASDVSFPGTIVIVYLIGRLFALAWLDTLAGANPFAVVMFSQFLIMLFYFPANNQLLQSGEGFAAFWVTLFFWWRTRRPAQPLRAREAGCSA